VRRVVLRAAAAFAALTGAATALYIVYPNWLTLALAVGVLMAVGWVVLLHVSESLRTRYGADERRGGDRMP
jgi:hypothetical protein